MIKLCFGFLCAACIGVGIPASAADRVTVDNFTRVESDLYFAKFVASGAFGSFLHAREPVPVEKQDVIRMNRDTLYSYAIADLGAGPATVTLPAADSRFRSLQVINEDHYTPAVIYDSGVHHFTQDQVGTRYVLFLIRTFVDPENPDDLAAVHRAQDAMQIEQGQGAVFEIPDWNREQATGLRNALNALAAANGGIDSARMFGPKEKVDEVQHLIGTASGWGGNPLTDAYYAGVTPEHNDGKTTYRLTVGKVPVDGFWSISVYNADGYFQKNDLNRYSLNNVTASKSEDGSVTVQFGDCKEGVPNCLPISAGWNYLVRMYRPHEEILDGTWVFPTAIVKD
ncbi:DUF1214 domain-containing protein [Paracoccus sp. MBLB3053]|uniref:DUF1214 domain-containing protein n=1 Tax=Paracoccus aurantius TaxID=3073814 RepID=A0ABU2HXD9_9RHOB|nr:DUF1214 domain-containing protein [Paracoccus sp. MBLB3053]MDS9469724.1 DUF1214 domain-containing protein [Paracoccus sp. MBLB3053]